MNEDPEFEVAFKEWAESVRRGALEKMAGSNVVISLLPTHEVDIKFAVETGLAILLDKPMLAVVMPGAEVPRKLALVLDKVVYADIDTEEGRHAVARALAEFARETDN